MASFAEMIYGAAQQDLSQPGTASHAAQGLMQGVKLAEEVNAIQDRKVQLELQKQQLQEKKQESLFKYLELGMTKIPQKARKAYFKNYFQKQADMLGIPVDPTAMEVILTQMDTDPKAMETFINLREAVNAGDADTAREAANLFAASIGDVEKAGSMLTDLYRIDSQLKDAEARRLETRENRFTEYGKALGAAVDANFDKIQQSRQGLRSSYAGLTNMLARVKDNPNARLDEQEFNSLATGIIRAGGETGPLAEGDVERLLGQSGIEGKWESFKTKWVTGTVTKEKVEKLKRLAELFAKQIDIINTEKVAQVRSRFNVPQFRGRESELEAMSGLNAMDVKTLPDLPADKKQPTFDPKPFIDRGFSEAGVEKMRNTLATIKDPKKLEATLKKTVDDLEKRGWKLSVEELKRLLGVANGK